MKWSDPAAFQLSYYRSPGFKQKKLDVYAAQATRLHPLVGDWICAAPILAVALNDERYYQGLFDLANVRGRCVEALRLCHLPTPMRKQTPAEADEWVHWKEWRSVFPEMPDSELAQLLAKLKGRERAEWMSRLAVAIKRRPPRTDFSEYARWAVRTSAAHPRDKIYQATDFMKSNEYDLSWTMGQFERAHAVWVERLRAEWAMQRERANDAYIASRSARDARFQKMIDEVIPFAPFPVEWETSLAKVTALNTARALMDEGAKMRHCVGGEQFRQAMRRGRALYFHIEAGAERSTLEIQKHGDRYMLGQHCGPCNARPGAAPQATASALLEHGLKAAADASGNVQERK